MKKFLLVAIMMLIYGAVNAQIGEIKNQGSTAYIYNEQASYSGYSISLSGGREILGYNSKYAVVQDGSVAYIYDSKGSYTGYSISLSSGRRIKNVTVSNILVKDGSTVYYYDFKGSYTGNSTSD